MSLRIAGLCLLASCIAVSADTLPAILNRMDAAAPTFHAATADVLMDTYDSLLSDHTKENGTLQMQRDGKNQVRAILTFTGKDSARTLAFEGKKLLIYFPNANAYQQYDMGSKSQLLNQYLLLGFGSSGKDLQKSYDITDGGPETVNGQATTKLILIPKSAETKDKLNKVAIWIPADGANPVQQQFFQPNGNYRKVTYTSMEVNPPMNGQLTFPIPAGAKRTQ